MNTPLFTHTRLPFKTLLDTWLVQFCFNMLYKSLPCIFTLRSWWWSSSVWPCPWPWQWLWPWWLWPWLLLPWELPPCECACLKAKMPTKFTTSPPTDTTWSEDTSREYQQISLPTEYRFWNSYLSFFLAKYSHFCIYIYSHSRSSVPPEIVLMNQLFEKWIH